MILEFLFGWSLSMLTISLVKLKLLRKDHKDNLEKQEELLTNKIPGLVEKSISNHFYSKSKETEEEITKLSGTIVSLRRKNEDLDFEVRRLSALLKDAESKLQQKESNKNVNVPNSELIKQAIDIAVKKSHPDNGGNSDDFVKFRKLQKDYSGMVEASNRNSTPFYYNPFAYRQDYNTYYTNNTQQKSNAERNCRDYTYR